MSSVGRIRIDDCSHDRTLLVELTIILLRSLRACLEGRCWQLPRFFANANQIILYRAFGRCKQRPLEFGHLEDRDRAP